jgi:hypothetical protein
LGFLDVAGQEGYDTRFLGPAQIAEQIVAAVVEWTPDILALSYRLNPEALPGLLTRLKQLLRSAGAGHVRMIFGGTDPGCRQAMGLGLFEATFGSGARADAVRRYLRGDSSVANKAILPDTLVSRIKAKAPFPLIRHHFGRPTVDETVDGSRAIAEAEVLDVLSLGPDQNAQSKFFRPEDMDRAADGAGGVPLRTERDLVRIYEATRTGNYPLVRCYSGTTDLIRFAAVLRSTIRNAWAAVPLFWYNVLDGRSQRRLRDSIRESQAAIAWHAHHDIPVEVNESHQWSLRNAPDTVAVVTFFLAAYNARRLGVRDYVAQFMFNTPRGTTPAMDMAKMLAKIQLVSELESDYFRIWRQTRTGLAGMPADKESAIGHLCASTSWQMALKPHIVHVVAYSEADHAATAEDVITSARIASGAINSLLQGIPDFALDPIVIKRKDELIFEAGLLVNAIREIAAPEVADPLTDVETLARAVECGLLDAPDLAGNPTARGAVRASLEDGACRAVDEQNRPLAEAERIARCLSNIRTN